MIFRTRWRLDLFLLPPARHLSDVLFGADNKCPWPLISTLFAGCWKHTRWQHKHHYSWCRQLWFNILGNYPDRPFWTQSAPLHLVGSYDSVAGGSGHILLLEGPHWHWCHSIRLAPTCQFRRLRYRLLIWFRSNSMADDGRNLTR